MTKATRVEELASQFEAAQDEFIALIDSLTDEQWQRPEPTTPRGINDEDEGRTVAVMAHHVAITSPLTMARIEDMLAGRRMSPVNTAEINAEHARENAGCSRDEVLRLLGASEPEIAVAIRAIPDTYLDARVEGPSGRYTTEYRVQEFLTGHVKVHQGSIEQAIRR